MRSPQVTFHIIEGFGKHEEFVFNRRSLFLVGREKDCSLQLPNDEAHQVVSRYHCLFDVNPPFVCVRDLESLNGTFVNGRRLEKPHTDGAAAGDQRFAAAECILRDGDDVRVGPTVFRVQVQGLESLAGHSNCEACAWCTKSVLGELKVGWTGDYICAECRSEPHVLVNSMIAKAGQGSEALEMLAPYKVLEEMSRDDLCGVYHVRHDETGELAVLKIMMPRIPVDEQRKAELLREVQRFKALQHPNIASLYDDCYFQGAFLFLQEDCKGGSLDELLFQMGDTLPVGEAREILLQVLDGLDYCHNASLPAGVEAGEEHPGHGLAHEDIKPSTIRLSDPGYAAKIADFGLASGFARGGLAGFGHTGFVGAGPAFMPRTRLLSIDLDSTEVDVWAAAATLYFMITGHFPRDFPVGKDPLAFLLQSRPIPVWERDPSVPQKLAQVIDAALADRRQMAFKTATELRQALEETL